MHDVSFFFFFFFFLIQTDLEVHLHIIKLPINNTWNEYFYTSPSLKYTQANIM